MAAIDKIYINTYDQYILFRDWCRQQPPIKDKYGKEVRLIDYVYKCNEPFSEGTPVFKAPYYLDAYLIRNCPFDFIQKELMLNYGHWSQEKINKAYKIVTNRTPENKDYYTWLSKDDFAINEDGIITMLNLEKSDYQKIKDGELYASPKKEYEYGKHFRCKKHPVRFYNRPFKQKLWMVSVDTPDEWMWYHSNHNSWSYTSEFVHADWSSSVAFVHTIKALKRLMLKWKLPIGAKVTAVGRCSYNTYEFIVTK